MKEATDVSKADFEQALSAFSDESAGADFVIVYFAGHTKSG